MWVLFFLGGMLGVIVCAVVLIVKAVKKKPKKVMAIVLAAFLVMGVSSMVYAMSAPAIDPSTVVENGEIVNAVPSGENAAHIENETQPIDANILNITNAFERSSVFSPIIATTDGGSGRYDVTSICVNNQERYADIRWCSIDYIGTLDSVYKYHPEIYGKIGTYTAAYSGIDVSYCATVSIEDYASENDIVFINLDNEEETIVTENDRKAVIGEYAATRERENAKAEESELEQDTKENDKNDESGLKLGIIATDGAKVFSEKYNVPINHAKQIETYIKTMTEHSLDNVSQPTASYEDDSTIQYDFLLDGKDYWIMINNDK